MSSKLLWKLVAGALLLMTIPVATLLFTIYRAAPQRLSKNFGQMEFSSLDWRKADSETRGKMVHSLLSKHSLNTMTRSEIVELLGPPDRNLVPENDLGYALGAQGCNERSLFGEGFTLAIFPHSATRSRLKIYPEYSFCGILKYFRSNQ